MPERAAGVVEPWRAALVAGLRALQVDPALAAPLARYLALLDKWNAAYNLTAVRDPAAMVTRHILDSLAVLPWLRGRRILDVGTGAGLPGIPLALACRERRFVLLDSNGKKTRFVTQALLALGLDNAEVVKARVEGYRAEDGFATILSRAFAGLADFVAATRHLLAPGGRWLALKGARPEAELAGLPADVRVTGVHRLNVPGLRAERHLVELETS